MVLVLALADLDGRGMLSSAASVACRLLATFWSPPSTFSMIMAWRGGYKELDENEISFGICFHCTGCLARSLARAIQTPLPGVAHLDELIVRRNFVTKLGAE